MSSPLPTNAKHFKGDDNNNNLGYDELQVPLSSSYDRASSMARLQAVSSDAYFGTSPARSVLSNYGGTHDLTKVHSHQSGVSQNSHQDDSKIAKAVKRHLVNPNQQASLSPTSSYIDIPNQHGNSGNASYANSINGDNLSVHSGMNNYSTSIHSRPGASVTHDIYKWTDNVDEQLARKKRSQSFVVQRSEPSDPALARLKDPGGFRRHFIADKANKQGKKLPLWMTGTFVEFLALYGHFGGEDLSDDEGESDDEDLLEQGSSSGGLRRRRHHAGGDGDENTPLIKRQEAAPQGTASPTKTVFLLLKSFVGTGVMFLPKAFYNGGLVFSTVVLTLVAAVSLYTSLLLVETRSKYPLSFGDIGGVLYGKLVRNLVLISITLSQIGFVCAYMVFVAENLQSLVKTIYKGTVQIPIAYLIIVQIIIFVPIAMIRKIQKLSSFALIADLFILLGLIYLYYFDFFTLATEGIADVEWFINTKDFGLFIGTAIFTYEGIGLVIPITESMKEPEKFPKVLSWTMVGVTSLFLSVGFISYLAFGSHVQTVILLNLPQTTTVNTIQGLYAAAICLSIPLQLFPAIRITENGLFSKSGKNNPIVKWQKNLFRFAAVLICTVIAIGGSGDLDKFVSIIGSFCCVPLCFIFPPLFHLKAVAHSFTQKTIDVTIIIFGVICMVYTTGSTVLSWTGNQK
ncbi:unnamed protein product [Cunninghamella blakesleeana]